ncbi:hypothetical protein GBF38_009408 [Nibea albiflora]|uniref:Uncharacterized protein n=1 Tax=Nibea albiflora TaxID=240163 RepID=A0ACB7F8R5_NIBAL|nr:hypothetical protein GBF38_009408 [Nibea albiflora]
MKFWRFGFFGYGSEPEQTGLDQVISAVRPPADDIIMMSPSCPLSSTSPCDQQRVCASRRVVFIKLKMYGPLRDALRLRADVDGVNNLTDSKGGGYAAAAAAAGPLMSCAVYGSKEEVRMEEVRMEEVREEAARGEAAHNGGSQGAAYHRTAGGLQPDKTAIHPPDTCPCV